MNIIQSEGAVLRSSFPMRKQIQSRELTRKGNQNTNSGLSHSGDSTIILLDAHIFLKGKVFKNHSTCDYPNNQKWQLLEHRIEIIGLYFI